MNLNNYAQVEDFFIYLGFRPGDLPASFWVLGLQVCSTKLSLNSRFQTRK